MIVKTAMHADIRALTKSFDFYRIILSKNPWNKLDDFREGNSMLVSATEFKNNIGRYLSIVVAEDIFITKNGKNIARLTKTTQDKVELAKSLFGIIPPDMTLAQAKEERLARYESTD